MKKLLVVLILSLLFVQMAVAGEKTDRERYDLIGPVKSVFYDKAWFSGEPGKRVEGQRTRKEMAFFTVKGDLTEKAIAGEEWKAGVFEVWEYIYDAKGNLIEERRGDMFSTGAVVNARKTIYTYDAKGNMTEAAWYDAKDSLLGKTIHTYDTERNMLKYVVLYNADGSLDCKSVYTYDAKGNMTGIVDYNDRGSLKSKTVYTYDAKGNTTKKAWYNADGSLDGKFTFTYDAAGNQIEEAKYNDRGSLVLKKTFDTKGNLTEKVEYKADGSLDSRIVRAYDAKGNLTEKVEYNAKGALAGKYIYTYEFDSTGNWTKRTESEWVTKFGKSYFEPSEALYRGITYHLISSSREPQKSIIGKREEHTPTLGEPQKSLIGKWEECFTTPGRRPLFRTAKFLKDGTAYIDGIKVKYTVVSHPTDYFHEGKRLETHTLSIYYTVASGRARKEEYNLIIAPPNPESFTLMELHSRFLMATMSRHKRIE